MGRLVAVFLLAAALSLPFSEVPVIDDWAYYYSVDHLLRSGRFHILDYSCRYNLAQVLWGALFALPAGLSFTALRLSTLVLSVGGLAAFADLLRRRTGDPALALWIAALLAFNPLFFRLSLSYMTDVPLIAVVAIAFWLFDLGLRAERRALLGAGVGLLVVGYLVRELAIVAPVALLAGALVSRPRRISIATLVGLAALAAVGFGLELRWIRAVQGVTSGLNARTEGLRHLLEVPLSSYVGALLQMLLTLAAFVAPASLATIRGRAEVVFVVAGGLLLAVGAIALGAVPFGDRELLSPLGLGMSRVLLPGDPRIAISGQVIRSIVFLVASGSLAALAWELVVFLHLWSSEREPLDAAWLLFGLGEIAALLVLWLWQDRYDLVLLPPALWMLALRAKREGWNRGVIAAGAIAFAVVSVLGTRDDFELNRAAWAAEASLRQEGVSAADIDAGYVLNGWRLYAYADEFAPGYPADAVPFLFAKGSLPYLVSTTETPGGEVLREYQWPRTWLSQPSLYVLRR